MRTLRVPVLVYLLASGCTAVQVGSPAAGVEPAPAPESVGAEVVALTNEERRRNGLPALAMHPRLMEAARLHAGQMAAHRRLAHTINGATYPTMQSRLEVAGYSYLRASENIAWNQRSAREVIVTWMNSSGHRANILDPAVTEMGAAMARASNGEPYWVQVFGRSR